MKKCIKIFTSLTAVVLTALFGLTIYLDMTLPETYYVVDGQTVSFHTQIPLEMKEEAGNGRTAAVSGNANATKTGKIMLFGIIPVKSTHIDVVEEKMLIPCGTPFGIKMFTDGVLVVGVNEVITDSGSKNPAKEAGIKLGDSIISIDGTEMLSNEDVGEAVSSSNGKTLKVCLKRDGTEMTVDLKPVLSNSDGKYKAGIWVRDSSAGIGTVTYYDPANSCFGGLGHAICDVDTGDILPLMSGEVVDVNINGVTKGQKGAPGELRGSFVSRTAMGSLLLNNETGVFGVMDYCPAKNAKAMPLAMKQEVKTGKATILTTLDGQTPKEYEIRIEKANIGSTNMTKNMVIEVTDPELLEKAGGIVQGMSGSPIIQDGKLVGAVTHVLINDPTKGYGIFAENMYTFSKDLESNEQNTAA